MMEVTKVLTSVFVLCLSGPTLGYPFTHSNLFSGNGGTGPRGQQDQQQLPAHLEDYLANRGSQQQAEQHLPTHLEDYLANYVQGARQYQPQYQPAYQQQQGYIAQVPQQKLSAETLAALLPYLSSSSSSLNGGSAAMASSDYAYPEYPAAAAAPAYTDDEGTWYDDMAQQQLNNNEPTQQDEEQVVLQLLLDHLNGRYSLDDLAALEREAEIEENTESQLQSLMNKKVRRHEIMNDFSNGDEQHLTIRRLREHVGDNSEQEKDGDNIQENENNEQDSRARDNTQADSQKSASKLGPSQDQDHKSSADTSTGLHKRSWGRSRGQTVGHLSFWGHNRYQSHRARKGDIGHINFFSHR